MPRAHSRARCGAARTPQALHYMGALPTAGAVPGLLQPRAPHDPTSARLGTQQDLEHLSGPRDLGTCVGCGRQDFL